MIGTRMGMGLAGAVAMAATLGMTASADILPTELQDTDNFTFAGTASQGPGFWTLSSNQCSGMSVSFVDPTEVLAEGLDMESNVSCQVNGQGQGTTACQDGPGGNPIWTGTLTISETGSDSYSGNVTITWHGAVGSVSGTLSETENGVPTGESAPVGGNINAPGPLPPGCPAIGPFPVNGNLNTTA